MEIQEKSLKQEIERAESHQKVVGEEIETNRNGTRRNSGKTKRRENKRAKKPEKRDDAATENLAKIAQKLNEARAKTESENAVLNEKRTLAATSSERRRSAQSALRRVENE